MESKVIILVTDRGDDKHGEISVVDDLKKAEQLVETILQAGFEQERIRVFSGEEIALQVTFRPVVSLGNAGTPPEAVTPTAKSRLDEDPPGNDLDDAISDESLAARRPALKLSSLFRND